MVQISCLETIENYASVLIFQGHAYNTFPKMGDTWIPDDVFDMKPLIRNFFENTSTVQVISLSKISYHCLVTNVMILWIFFHMLFVEAKLFGRDGN